MTDRLTLTRPDDWHLHLRDGEMMAAVLPASAAQFGRALVMPNLTPPVVTAADARAYRDRIRAALPAGADFTPLMTLYLTDDTDPDDMAAAAAEGLVTAVKLYPRGATTNAASGVTDVDKVRGVLERMAEIGLPLCVHGEVTDADVDIFDREAAFIEGVLDPLRRATPGLRVVMEHITTADAARYVTEEGSPDLAATITVHHLMLDRNALLAGGIRPHYYCLPVLKRAHHRDALRQLATSNFPRVFLGTDSAPHTDPTKIAPCGCAGCYTAPVALSCLAQVFEEEDALERLEPFAALNGAAFYGLAPNAGEVTLTRGAPDAAPAPQTPDGPVTVFDPGTLTWRVTT